MPPVNACLSPVTDITEQAAQEQRQGGKATGTSVDSKIQRRLASNLAIKERMASLKRKRAAPAASAGGDADSEGESEDDDAPLPGELDSDDGAAPICTGCSNRYLSTRTAVFIGPWTGLAHHHILCYMDGKWDAPISKNSITQETSLHHHVFSSPTA